MPVKWKKNKPIYWECKENSHYKFWAAQIIKEDNRYILIRKWGKIGTEGQSMEQYFDTYEEAEKVLNDLIWRKENKGYNSIF